MTCKNCSSCRYLPIINKHICYGVKEPFYIKDIDAKCSEYSDEYWSKQERTKTTQNWWTECAGCKHWGRIDGYCKMCVRCPYHPCGVINDLKEER